jgi:hypothetical protein
VNSSGDTFPHVDREKGTVQVATGLGELFEVTTDIRAAMDAARRIAGRSLTREEWAAHVGHEPYQQT